MSKEKGIPAFPNSFGNMGMSLRDYFAAKAMQAMMGAASPFLNANGSIISKPVDFASAAYDYADAMLEERNK